MTAKKKKKLNPKKGEPIFWDSASAGKFEHVWNAGELIITADDAANKFESMGYINEPLSITNSTNTVVNPAYANKFLMSTYYDEPSYAEKVMKHVLPPPFGGGGTAQMGPLEPPKHYVATQVQAVQWTGHNLAEVAALMGYGITKGPGGELIVHFTQDHAYKKGNLTISSMNSHYGGSMNMEVTGFGNLTASFNLGDWVIRNANGATVMDKETFGLLFSESTPLEEM